MAQMQTLSIRIPDDDFQWLLSIDAPGARTPSEKLRQLVTKAREQDADMSDVRRCTTWMREFTQPLLDAVVNAERTHKLHSDLLANACEHIPNIMASLISAQTTLSGSGSEQPLGALQETEAILMQQCFRFFNSLLRIGITTNPSLYDGKLLDQYLDEILEITAIISTRKAKENSNG